MELKSVDYIGGQYTNSTLLNLLVPALTERLDLELRASLFGPPVLEPGLNLSFAQRQLLGDLPALRGHQVLERKREFFYFKILFHSRVLELDRNSFKAPTVFMTYCFHAEHRFQFVGLLMVESNLTSFARLRLHRHLHPDVELLHVERRARLV